MELRNQIRAFMINNFLFGEESGLKDKVLSWKGESWIPRGYWNWYLFWKSSLAGSERRRFPRTSTPSTRSPYLLKTRSGCFP